MRARQPTNATIALGLLVIACSATEGPAASPAAAMTPPSRSTHSTGPAGVGPTPPVVSLAPTPSPSPTDAPSATPAVHTGFRYSDILRVEADRLAVRQGPSRDSPLVQGERGSEPIGEIRLRTGDFVSVDLGPLPVGDTVWYLVWPAEDARLHYSTTNWIVGPGSGPGWVAGSVGDARYLRLHRRPETSEIEEYLPVGLNVSGTGDHESEPIPRHDLFAFSWAIAARDDGSPCGFTATLVPEREAPPVIAVDATTSRVAQGPMTGSTPGTPWGRSAGGAWDTFTVSIVSGCAWSIRLVPLPHD